MNLEKVNRNNIDTLYKLNFQLASDEGQEELFTVEKEKYSSAFLGSHPILHGYILFSDNNDPIGFYVYNFKFASYVGAKVLYIEDIYLVQDHRDLQQKKLLLGHAVQNALHEECCRIELRMLKSFNIGYDIVESLKFKPVHKWEVYRLEWLDQK